ncbi:hypothetical protein [Allobaculum sp. JKK-2023]|uniref:hypothetical protein n=1 Tax=Allobaculum sp. JKK-2023 TaxID=3108943 RepID=UPI002B05B380|nr:hypothetical protein [Allobaculum sp. JKK-2023]
MRSLLIALSIGISSVCGSSYNETVIEEVPQTDLSQTDLTDEFIPLDDYNKKYAGDDYALVMDSNSLIDEEYDILSLSPVQTKTAQFLDSSGSAIGYVTLQYQTQVIGGRPQFAYDTCLLSTPVAYNGWQCTSSYASYSGDMIKVYGTFVFGAFQEQGVATFRP